MQIAREFSPRTPTDVDFFLFDFGDCTAVNLYGDVGAALADGETIVASPAPAVAASVYAHATQPASPAALTVVGADIQDGPTMPASRVMTSVQAGGTAEATYLLSCTITTSTGRTITRSATVLTTSL